MKDRKKQATALALATIIALSSNTYVYALDNQTDNDNANISTQAVGDVAINNTNFPSNTFRKYILDNFDSDKNQSLSLDEIEKVTSIDANDIGYQAHEIFDLTGIKFFTNLKSLSCRAITTRDLYGFNGLDVSGLEQLESVDCANSGIPSINVSGCTNLTNLDLSKTKISSLDISDCANLKNLYLSETEISSLDVTDCINLKYLDCSQTAISQLDVSKCMQLETLICNNTQIIQLDVSNLAQLKKLDCYSNENLIQLTMNAAIQLNGLDCSNTSISNLDLSGLTNLQKLNCSSTDISNLDIKHLDELRSLYCADTDISDLDLSNSYELRTLDCNNTAISCLDLSYLNQLMDLNFSNTLITSIDVSHCSVLQYLDCSYTYITYLDLTQNVSLIHLDVKGCQLAYINISENNNNLYLSPSNLTASFDKVVGSTFNIKEMFPGIDVDKITITSDGVKLDKDTGIISGYTTDLPTVTYQYNLGYKNEVLKVTLNLKIKGDTTISFKDSSLEKVYTGNSISLTKNDCLIEGSNGDVTFEYRQNVNGEWENMTSMPKNAGTYQVKATVNEDSDYISATTEWQELIVEKATPEYEIPNNLGAVYGQKLSDISLPDGFSWNDPTKLVGNVGINTFKVTYTPNDTINYNVVKDIDVQVTVSQATNSWVKELNIADWTYGEKAKTPTATAKYGDVIYTYSNSEDGSFTDKAPTNVGTYYVKAEVKETQNYKGISYIKSFNIKKAKASNIELPEKLSAKHGDTLSTIELPNDWEWVDKDVKVKVNQIQYKAKYKVDDVNYDYSGVEGYNATGHYVEKLLTVTVDKADSTIEIIDDLNTVYTGNQISLTKDNCQITGSTGKLTFKYQQYVKDQWEDMTSIPTNAGTYQVKAIIEEDENYLGTESQWKEFTISKVTNDWKEKLDIANWTYGEEANAPTAVANHGEVTYTYSNSKDENFTEDVPTEAGTWYVKATVAGTNNYTELDATTSFVIEQAVPQFDIPIDLTATYGDKLSSIVLPKYTSGTLKWKDDTQVVGNAGINTFEAIFMPNDNNYKVVTVNVSVNVGKAIPAYTAPTGIVIGQGKKLDSVTLTNGFRWKDGNTIASELGTHSYEAIYTPDDIDNYETIELTISIEVIPVLTPLNQIPTITAEDRTLTVGDAFNPLDKVSANDIEDGDLTDKIEVISNDVNTSKIGTYSVTYKVTDNDGASTSKIITVTIKEKEDTDDPGDEQKPSVDNKTDNGSNSGNTVNTSGDDKGSINSTDSLKTGDMTNIGLWSLFLALSGGILNIITRKKYKKDLK